MDRKKKMLGWEDGQTKRKKTDRQSKTDIARKQQEIKTGDLKKWREGRKEGRKDGKIEGGKEGEREGRTSKEEGKNRKTEKREKDIRAVRKRHSTKK